MSRVHPGKSNTYQYKVLRRKEREFDRELLRLAKIKHDKEFGVGACLDWVKIRRFKREIRARIKCGDKVEGYTGIAGQEKWKDILRLKRKLQLIFFMGFFLLGLRINASRI